MTQTSASVSVPAFWMFPPKNPLEEWAVPPVIFMPRIATVGVWPPVGTRMSNTRSPEIERLAGTGIATVVGPRWLSGGSGNDRLSGGSGRDRLFGGGSNDRLSGGGGNDRLSGGGGNDQLSGGGGVDRLAGGRGRNSYSAGAGNDVVNSANRKKETVNCGGGRRDRVRADARDSLRGCEVPRIVP
jgi:hemolysin type calcium-binding protein